MSLLKHIVTLDYRDNVDTITSLVQAGMRVALLDSAYKHDICNTLQHVVKSVFLKLNTPIGLMLRLTPENKFIPLENYQYILLDGFNPREAQELIDSKKINAKFLVEEPLNTEQWIGLVDGIVTKDKDKALKYRLSFSLIVFSGEDVPTCDALIWPVGTSPNTILSAPKSVLFSTQNIDLALKQVENSSLSCKIVEYAIKTKVDAIIIFTCDGENVFPITRFNPPMPVIVIGKRPESEAILLMQTMTYGVLPTAITNVPQNTVDLPAFARYVASLYGYLENSKLVATGHYLQTENQSSFMTNF